VDLIKSTDSIGNGSIIDVFLEYGRRSKYIVTKHATCPGWMESNRTSECPRVADPLSQEPCAGPASGCCDYLLHVYGMAKAQGGRAAAISNFPWVVDLLP
jgi:hypothetical protein